MWISYISVKKNFQTTITTFKSIEKMDITFEVKTENL